MAGHRARALALVLFAMLALSAFGARHATTLAEASSAGQIPERPNVVLIVADDLDKKLLEYMPQTRSLIGEAGASFDRFYVEQSTCCTSRSTFLTGQYTHNHGVRGNHWPAGGFLRFRDGQAVFHLVLAAVRLRA